MAVIAEKRFFLNTCLQEFCTPWMKVCAPCERGDRQHLITRPPTVVEPLHTKGDAVVISPSCNPAAEVTILNVDPGS